VLKQRLFTIVTFVALAGSGAIAQSGSLIPIRFLEGKWEGKATGEPRNGVSSCEYRFDLNGRFLSARNRSIYEPKTADAKPEVHEDFGMYSYDKALKEIVSAPIPQRRLRKRVHVGFRWDRRQIAGVHDGSNRKYRSGLAGERVLAHSVA
jgi:hypothetical protein